jgi:hypothetical protein
MYETADFKQFLYKINSKYEEPTISKYQMKIMNICTYIQFILFEMDFCTQHAILHKDCRDLKVNLHLNYCK